MVTKQKTASDKAMDDLTQKYPDLLEKLVKDAKEGNVSALEYLKARVMGEPIQPYDVKVNLGDGMEVSTNPDGDLILKVGETSLTIPKTATQAKAKNWRLIS